ncbi:MAG: hypothetical protein Q8M08_10315, partial [Bacteroidales bacterium]|nr:hypothetical protein [Bacteroidales bacterium]
RWNFFSAMPAYQGVHRRYFVTSTKSTYFGGINLSQEVVSVWVGAESMIMFLPFAAMLKVVCEEYEELKPIALIIGEKNIKEKSDGYEQFLSRWWEKIKSGFRIN